MYGASHAGRKRAAIVVFALSASVSACSTSEPPPLALALEASQIADQPALPEGAAVVPTVRPDTSEVTGTAQTAEAAQPEAEPVQTAAAQTDESRQTEQTALSAAATQTAMPAPEVPKTAIVANAPAPVVPKAEVAEAAETPADAAIAQPDSTRFAAAQAPAQPKKRKAFLSSLFKSSASRPQAKPASAKQASRSTKLALVDPEPAKTRKIISTTSSPARASVSSLPGVRREALFEIKHGDGSNDISDIDVNESDGSYQVASAAGLARLAPNGLRTQHSGVDVKCLKPELVRVLKTVERKYGRPVVVTSGYRNPNANKRAGGAKKSLHMYCAAADIQVEGVSKWALASYLRTMPGRGGVGTYCHTQSVHIDIGPKRDWNWRCRRRK